MSDFERDFIFRIRRIASLDDLHDSAARKHGTVRWVVELREDAPLDVVLVDVVSREVERLQVE